MLGPELGVRVGEDLSLISRSVYLHNNKLADAGLPDNMFNGSSNVEILILSSNFLRHVPKHLPPALYKLHLKVGGRGQGGAGTTLGEIPGPRGHIAEDVGPWAPAGRHSVHCCQHITQGALGSGPLSLAPQTPPTPHPRALPFRLTVPHIPSPTTPLTRTTSWRRSRQVPSVS